MLLVQTATPEMLGRLSRREVDVGRGICAGKSNAQIARDLGISYGSLVAYVRRLAYKLHIKGKADDRWGKRIKIAVILYEFARQFPLVAVALDISWETIQ